MAKRLNHAFDFMCSILQIIAVQRIVKFENIYILKNAKDYIHICYLNILWCGTCWMRDIIQYNIGVFVYKLRCSHAAKLNTAYLYTRVRNFDLNKQCDLCFCFLSGLSATVVCILYICVCFIIWGMYVCVCVCAENMYIPATPNHKHPARTTM